MARSIFIELPATMLVRLTDDGASGYLIYKVGTMRFLALETGPLVAIGAVVIAIADGKWGTRRPKTAYREISLA